MISRIPNPEFVFCKECVFRRPKKIFLIGKIVRVYVCLRTGARLRGRKGCEKGRRKSDNKKQEVLDEK